MGITNDILVEREEDQGARNRSERLRHWLDTFDYLWSRRWSVFRWTVLGTVLTAAIAWKICLYEATAQVMPPDNSNSNLSGMALSNMLRGPSMPSGLSGLAGDLLGVKSSGALFVKILNSHSVQNAVIDAYQLRSRYSWFGLGGTLDYENARDKLESRTSISEDKKSGVISITARDHNKDLAQKLASEYVKQLDHKVVEVATSAARRERIFIEQRLQEEKKTLAESEQRFSSFATSSMALDVPQQTRMMLEASARLEGELIVARSELKGLEQTYTDENPRVRTLRARVSELDKELKRINGQAPAGDSRTSGDASNPYPSVKALPSVGVQWAELYRDRKTHETVFEMLTQQYEMARVQEAREIPTVKVLDNAELPEKVHPRPLLVFAIGALVSAILACIGLNLQRKWQAWDIDDPRRLILARLTMRTKL